MSDPKANAKTVGEALAQAVGAAPQSRACVHESQEFTFLQMDEISDSVACGLLNMGLGKGDRIGVLLPNIPAWLYLYFAAAKIGAVIVGLSVRHSIKELRDLIEFGRVSTLVAVSSFGDKDFTSLLALMQKEDGFKAPIFFVGQPETDKGKSFEELRQTPVNKDRLEKAKSQVEADDELLILHTSGSTGRSKGTTITHRNQLAAASAQARHTRMRPGDLALVSMPLSHVGGIIVGVLSSLLGRAASLLAPQMDPGAVVELSARHRPSVVLGFPTMHTLLLRHPDFFALDTSAVRLVVTGGSKAELNLVKRLNAAYEKAVIMNLYGLTETSGGVVMTTWNSRVETVAQTVGKPFDGVSVKLVDVLDNEVQNGRSGEVLLKGDCVARGYFRLPEESRLAFDQSGWLRTGDIGFVNEEGLLALMGRKTEMYIQEGINVHPVEVEDCLCSHPGVVMAAGIGIPDPVLGEVGRYYVVPDPSGKPEPEELLRLCQEHLAEYKQPRQIIFRDALPTTATGKINKAALRKEFFEQGD
jgi:fatty-acyl-CoA synthase